jgi:hypothetical protein
MLTSQNSKRVCMSGFEGAGNDSSESPEVSIGAETGDTGSKTLSCLRWAVEVAEYPVEYDHSGIAIAGMILAEAKLTSTPTSTNLLCGVCAARCVLNKPEDPNDNRIGMLPAGSDVGVIFQGCELKQ